MAEPSSIGLSRLIVGIAAFVLVGFPLVGYVWESLNQLLAGEVRPLRLLISLPLLVLLAVLLALLSRAVRGWEAERQDRAHSPPVP